MVGARWLVRSALGRGMAPGQHAFVKEDLMSDVVKVIEVLSESEKSWEDAAQEAVRRAAKTLKDIRSIYIENFEARVEGDRIVRYRINGKISFLLE